MIYLGADHRGFLLKEKIKEYLRSEGLEVTDLGPSKIDPNDDFPIISIKLAENVVKKHGDMGVLICGSGAGACIASNKVVGARATLGLSPKQVTAAKNDDDINVLCLSASYVDEDNNLEMVDAFIKTMFYVEERFIRRLKQISDYELQKC